ncbi:hypothetical protein DICVIV_13736 [Dictyocaulus viviparus]|uniref:Uncharacterized protein n=1 Tax=Dictyocaulus viviparus TaxID=29172 RepID=A0A0D8X9L9_DICVI|nr:hypothetical protein DICVIV_13736 [Dictyocaulus viviparus]
MCGDGKHKKSNFDTEIPHARKRSTLLPAFIVIFYLLTGLSRKLNHVLYTLRNTLLHIDSFSINISINARNESVRTVLKKHSEFLERYMGQKVAAVAPRPVNFDSS